MNRIRAFVAIPIEEFIGNEIAKLIGKFRQPGDSIRWVAKENLHLTLAFLGEIDAIMVPKITEAIEGAIAEIPAFDMHVEGLGAFPNLNRPSILWVGITDGAEQVAEICEAVQAAIEPFGFPREHRKYVPHLTIGRIGKNAKNSQDLANRIEQHKDWVGGASPVSDVVFMESELGRSGPLYSVLNTCSLGDS